MAFFDDEFPVDRKDLIVPALSPEGKVDHANAFKWNIRTAMKKLSDFATINSNQFFVTL